MTMQMPEIEVDAHSGIGRPSVSWKDDSRRYHIWLNDNGTPCDDVLHSNPVVSSGRAINEHRSLSQSAKRWAPLVSAIVKKIKADDLIAKAREQAAAKAAAEKAERERKSNEAGLACLERALRYLPPGTAAAIRSLPETDKLAFVAAFY